MRWIAGVILAFVCFANFSAAASAQTLSNFDADVARRSAQCEIGQFAVTLDAEAPQPRMLIGSVSIEEEDVIAKSVEGGFSFWLWGKGGVTYENKTHSLGSRKFNVHPDNRETCNDRNHVNLGLVDCLKGEIGNFKGLGGYAQCDGESTATLSAKAGVHGEIWVVGFDASGSWQKKRTYKVTVRIPNQGDAPGTLAEKSAALVRVNSR